MVPTRLTRMKESATIKAAKKATEMRNKGIDVINFNLGEPDFDTPKHICDAATQAMYEGKTHYTPVAGIPELREAIAEKLKNENNLDVSASEVLVTPGAKQAIFYIMMSILDDGDEALLYDPSWVSYEECIQFAGANPVWMSDKDHKNNFESVNISDFITDKTRMIVINSPCNPTGSVYHKNTLKEIADIAIDHNLIVLSDEIYEKIIYDQKHISIGSMGDMQDRTITVNGFSKAYAMTGWRLGYVTAPHDILKGLTKIQSNSVTGSTTFVQYGGLAALQGTQEPIKEMVQEFQTRRDLLVKGLNKIGLKCHKPEGAFYAFPDISEFTDDGEKFTDKLLNEAHVSVTQGSAFGINCKNFVRLSYATSQDRIKEGLARIEKCLN